MRHLARYFRHEYRKNEQFDSGRHAAVFARPDEMLAQRSTPGRRDVKVALFLPWSSFELGSMSNAVVPSVAHSNVSKSDRGPLDNARLAEHERLLSDERVITGIAIAWTA